MGGVGADAPAAQGEAGGLAAAFRVAAPAGRGDHRRGTAARDPRGRGGGGDCGDRRRGGEGGGSGRVPPPDADADAERVVGCCWQWRVRASWGSRPSWRCCLSDTTGRPPSRWVPKVADGGRKGGSALAMLELEAVSTLEATAAAVGVQFAVVPLAVAAAAVVGQPTQIAPSFHSPSRVRRLSTRGPRRGAVAASSGRRRGGGACSPPRVGGDATAETQAAVVGTRGRAAAAAVAAAADALLSWLAARAVGCRCQGRPRWSGRRRRRWAGGGVGCRAAASERAAPTPIPTRFPSSHGSEEPPLPPTAATGSRRSSPPPPPASGRTAQTRRSSVPPSRPPRPVRGRHQLPGSLPPAAPPSRAAALPHGCEGVRVRHRLKEERTQCHFWLSFDWWE